MQKKRVEGGRGFYFFGIIDSICVVLVRFLEIN
jgi:hypothetical protein